MFALMVFAQGHAPTLLPTVGADIRTTLLRETLEGIAKRATEVRHTLDHDRRVERNGRWHQGDEGFFDVARRGSCHDEMNMY